eukprot:jgi/Chrzof1/11968/Cz06g16130.t1
MSSPVTASSLRLMSDLKAIQHDPPEGCSASPSSDESMYTWTATIFGPDDTPWEGGLFSLRITFTERYPDKPPRVRFTCPMFHPNVYDDGTVCLDIIQDQWSPCHNICTLLTSIRSLLNDPNTSSPANIDAANLYQKDRAAYNKRVRRLAQQTLECC